MIGGSAGALDALLSLVGALPADFSGAIFIVSHVGANRSQLPGDEVVEAYVKTPQAGGPLHSLVGFERVHLNAGEEREVQMEIYPRSLSSVDEKGERSIMEGTYHLTLSGAQPQEATAKSEIDFVVRGTKQLPK